MTIPARAGYGAVDDARPDDARLPPSSALPPPARPSWRAVATTAVAAALALVGARALPRPGPRAAAVERLRAPAAALRDEDRARFYEDQPVDHFGDGTATWSHRYYRSVEHFGGAGRPVFLVVGGEGAMDDGMLYPFVTRHLAPHFQAAVIQIEHRFYGPYRPIMGRDATVAEMLALLTPQQAMADMVTLVQAFKDELGCSYDRGDSRYCPVVAVGGSYPGFLSAMFRVAHRDVVDISYASSAPLKLYDQTADQDAYYDVVTAAAERASPGCADAVRAALAEARVEINGAAGPAEAARAANLCVDALPEYIDTAQRLGDDVMMAIGFSFANYDMEAYPPGKDLGLYKACRVFQDEEASALEKVAGFFQLLKGGDEGEGTHPAEDRGCFDLSVFLPDGDNARVETSDWSGSGGGHDGHMWDFQLCTTVIDPIGFSAASMFPPRRWTYEGLARYCRLRYGAEVVPRPRALAEDLGFDDLVGAGASRILFTNGLQDMWSGGSYLEDVSESILALNFENGAHHSDLSHVGPSELDTQDIREGFVKITSILERWLNEIKNENERVASR